MERDRELGSTDPPPDGGRTPSPAQASPPLGRSVGVPEASVGWGIDAHRRAKARGPRLYRFLGHVRRTSSALSLSSQCHTMFMYKATKDKKPSLDRVVTEKMAPC